MMSLAELIAAGAPEREFAAAYVSSFSSPSPSSSSPSSSSRQRRGGETFYAAWVPAAQAGRLDLLQWGARTGYLWRDGCCGRGMRDTEDYALLCAGAAAAGNLETLRWLREVAELPWDERVCTWAARGGHAGVLRWSVAHGAVLSGAAAAAAATEGHIDLLRELWEFGAPYVPPPAGPESIEDPECRQFIAEHGELWARSALDIKPASSSSRSSLPRRSRGVAPEQRALG